MERQGESILVDILLSREAGEEQRQKRKYPSGE